MSASTSSASSNASKQAERMKKLRELHSRRNEARKLNHTEVVEEDKRNKMPVNWERKRKQVEWEMEEEAKKKSCEAEGDDYDQAKLLEVGADEADRMERLKKKKIPDPGFSDYEAATFRQYQRLTKQMKPDSQEYDRLKEELGEEKFYASADTLLHGTHKPSEDAIDAMADDIEKQIEKRGKFSRRRAFDEEADVNYINKRNMNFNKKLERYYGKYTAEIKQNLERGTAV